MLSSLLEEVSSVSFCFLYPFLSGLFGVSYGFFVILLGLPEFGRFPFKFDDSSDVLVVLLFPSFLSMVLLFQAFLDDVFQSEGMFLFLNSTPEVEIGISFGGFSVLLELSFFSFTLFQVSAEVVEFSVKAVDCFLEFSDLLGSGPQHHFQFVSSALIPLSFHFIGVLHVPEPPGLFQYGRADVVPPPFLPMFLYGSGFGTRFLVYCFSGSFFNAIVAYETFLRGEVVAMFVADSV